MQGLLIALTAAAAILFFRRGSAAVNNLQITPVSVAIDSARTRAAVFTRIFYNIRLDLANPEPVPLPVRAMFFQVFFRDREISRINVNEPFTIPARGNREINLRAAVNSPNIVASLIDLIQDNDSLEIYVEGWVDTVAGRMPVQFTQQFQA